MCFLAKVFKQQSDNGSGFQPLVCFSIRYLGRCPQADMSRAVGAGGSAFEVELLWRWQKIENGSGLEGILCGKKCPSQ